jgi:hypothetical protein
MSDWKTIPKFKEYEINREGDVRLKRSTAKLPKRPIGDTFTYCLVHNDGNPKIRVVDSLLKATFEGEDNE